MDIETSYLERCVSTLEKANGLLETVQPENIEFDCHQ